MRLHDFRRAKKCLPTLFLESHRQELQGEQKDESAFEGMAQRKYNLSGKKTEAYVMVQIPSRVARRVVIRLVLYASPHVFP